MNNSNHVIIINDHAFKANESGMWNLTEIWKTLKLPDTKRPSNWSNATTKALKHSAEISALKVGRVSQVFGSKFATLQYAGWVSFEFNRMVYAAFESILAMPEVATVVANKMVELGHIAEAELLERMNADYADAMNGLRNLPHINSKRGLRNALASGNINQERFIELMKTARGR